MKASALYKKDNLDKLCSHAQQEGFTPLEESKIVPLCLHNVITNTIELIQLYVRTKSPSEVFPVWILQHFANKYEKKSNCNRAFYTHMFSWRKHLESSTELKLCLSFLTNQRGRCHILKHFLKIRKQIIKGKVAILDQVSLSHQLYPQSQRRIILKKINQCYLTQQQKSVNLRLQSSVLCQFLLKQIQESEANGDEFKITKQNRSKTKQIFNSQIHINNGIISPKIKQKEKDIETGRDLTKRTINTNISDSRRVNYQNQSSRVIQKLCVNKNQPQCSEENIMGRLNDSSEITSRQCSPGRLFAIQEKQMNNFYKIDQILECRKSNVSSFQKQGTSILSYITEKYSQDWSRMLQINQEFKNRVLQKTKEELDSIYKSSRQENSHVFYCIDPEHQLYQKDKVERNGFSFQDADGEQNGLATIRESTPKRNKKFYL